MLINIVLTREPGPAEGEERGGGLQSPHVSEN